MLPLPSAGQPDLDPSPAVAPPHAAARLGRLAAGLASAWAAGWMGDAPAAADAGRRRRPVAPESAVPGSAVPERAAPERVSPERAVLEALGVAVYTTDAAGRITFYNEAAAEFWGWRPKLGEQLWCGSWRLYRPDGTPLPHQLCPMATSIAEARPIRGAWAYAERPDGRRIPFAPFPTPLHGPDGRLLGAVNVLVDISGRTSAEAALASAEARFRTAQEIAPEGFLVLEALRGADGGLADFILAHANPAGARLLGRPAEALVGARLGMLPVGGDGAWLHGLAEDFRAILHTGTPLGRELRLDAGPPGEAEPRWLRAQGVRLGDGVAVLLEDVTERRLAEARIAHLARHDELTGLLNRRSFVAELARRLSRPGAPGLAVLRLDLDRFRALNDTLGHRAGDELLRAVGARLAACAGEDAAVARLDGDEFALLQAGPDQEARAETLARRIRAAFALPFELERYRSAIGLSLGIAVAGPASQEGAARPSAAAERLMEQADVALTHAKSEGRGGWRFFAPEMAVALRARLALEADLRQALPRGELELHYQPVVDLARNRICAAEALLRWTHPERGLVPPSEFIPVAEELGLIMPIGAWVLREACAAAAEWPAEIRVAVNLSPVQFAGGDVHGSVSAALAASGLDPARLELEITELALLQSSDSVLSALGRLRGMGVQTALDDFGTKYSSLGYLRSFPFDRIKIDGSFVREMDTRPDCAAIVRHVAGLAADLGMATTAEGVETARHLALVRALGCTQAQGYHLGRPAPRRAVWSRIVADLAVPDPGPRPAAQPLPGPAAQPLPGPAAQPLPAGETARGA